MSSLADHFSLEKEDVPHPVNYKTITRYQQKDKPLIETAKLKNDYSIKHFSWADKKYSLIYKKHKIVIPKLLEKQVVEWYCYALCHPGEIRTELSIAQYFYCNNLHKIGKSIMMDPATGWIEICPVPSACADLVSNIVELAWLTRYPLPSKVTIFHGNEFSAEFKTMIQADYGITVKHIS